MTTLPEAARAFTEAIDAWRTAPTKDERNNRLEDMWDAEQSLRDALAEDDGMVRVPREPSETMIDAAFDATVWPDLGRATLSDVMRGLRENMRKEWRAMLAAAKEGKS